MQAHALANLEKSVARAVEVGVEPRVLNETVGGSVKGALRALLDDSKAFLIAKQLYDGASDPKNPRQLDYISRLKEWTDGHETKQTRTETVSQRISLTLGGTEVGVPRADNDELSKLRSENAELRKLLLRISEQLEQDRKEALLSEAVEADVASDVVPQEHPLAAPPSSVLS